MSCCKKPTVLGLHKNLDRMSWTTGVCMVG